jgi:hypothetical protein
MDQHENWILLGRRVESTTIAYNLLIVYDSLEAEAAEFVLLYLESLCGSHGTRYDLGRYMNFLEWKELELE